MKKQILNKEELHHLAKVIGEVEKTTAGEVRLMIVRRSAVTGHVQTLLWALFVAASFLFIWFARHDLILWEPWWLWPTLLVGHYVLAGFLSHIEFVQRHLTPAGDLHHQVLARAEVEFYRAGLNRTRAHTGVLLFVSLMERQAVVLADSAIHAKAGPKAWEETVRLIVGGAKSGKWSESFERALRACGRYLSEHFPPQPGKTNELPNAVIVKD
jgi:putative membrane protein